MLARAVATSRHEAGRHDDHSPGRLHDRLDDEAGDLVAGGVQALLELGEAGRGALPGQPSKR